MKNYITIIFLFIVNIIYTQSINSVQDIFKSYFMLEDLSRTQLYKSGEDSLTIKFCKSNLIIDTLKIKTFFKNEDEPLIFYSLDIRKNDRSVFKEYHNFEYTNIGHRCNTYIIAVDKKSKMSFRLKGFLINDILPFSEYFYQSSSVNDLKDYEVEGLDLKCLLESLKNKTIIPNRKKYPCLEICTDPYMTYIH